MDTSTRAPGYDLFKLIVAVLLLLILLCLLFWIPVNAPPAETPTVTMPVTTTIAPPVQSPTGTSITATPPPPPSPTGTSSPFPLTPTALPPASSTATPSSVPMTATSLPPPSLTSTPSQQTTTPTFIPSPTNTTVPVTETPSSAEACAAALARSRLQAGRNATILHRLNFRSSPGIQNNWLRTNLPGTRVEVVDGPTCLPYLRGAYVWWQIRLPNGEVGWSAEASLFGRFYFIEPNP